MKIKENSVAHAVALTEGDSITVSVSHQVRIEGAEAWVRYEAQSKIRPGESVDEADKRVIKHVAVSVVAAAEAAAHEVINQNRRG